MAQGCLKCLKYTMCFANLLIFICGVAVLGFGVYMMVNFKLAALTPTLASFNFANMLLVCGIVITCVSFLGFLGALKENRCLLLTFFLLLFILMLVELTVACLLLMYEGEIGRLVKEDLTKGLEKARGSNSTSEWDLVQETLDCCGVENVTDWLPNIPRSCYTSGWGSSKPEYRKQGCLLMLKNLFEENFLTTGISVIVLCIIEVLGMCFAMTLFCHISRSGLGYKL
ncbi:leukocyte surface antigen CD53 [Etheostoma spectabile]|uniref:leukocyte surface antigen CD53 n=1 Tax=Etheostoma spectabile TaxID=54343 RepID=UPI0013AE8D53|nr:leukocyte surface antigen CD53-like [Etheostoma spectabile]XP_032372623.1 leukocyte surface antigen CD53-like [Etheostoma spectabile]